MKLWSTIFSCQKYSTLITFLWIFCTHNIQSWPRFSKCKRGMSWAGKGTENFFFAYFFWLALTKFKICRYSKNFWVCPFFCTINWLENGKLGQKNLTLTQESALFYIFITFLWGTLFFTFQNHLWFFMLHFLCEISILLLQGSKMFLHR